MGEEGRLVIQHMVLSGRDGIRQLYCRYPSAGKDSWPVRLEPGESLDLSAYFNLVSLDKWHDCTSCSDLRLEAECEGSLCIDAVLHTLGEGAVSSRAIASSASSGGLRTENVMLPEAGEGSVGFVFTAGEGGAVIHGADVTASVRNQSNARIEIVICTYRREEYVTANVRTILDHLDGIGGDYGDSVRVTVVDNGGTLELCNDPRLRVIRNRNLGGSGGYARGIMGAHDDSTHVVLMDDDTEIDPETVYRIWAFASCLDPEHAGCTIGGTMLRMDAPTVVHESSALMGRRVTVSNDHGSDLSGLEGCLELNRGKGSNYNAWWLCAFPRSVASRESLPMPFFFIYDDAEFGMRHPESEIVSMCGVSVWHQPFDSKYSSSRLYYIARNGMITRALHGGTCARNALNVLWTSVLSTFCYRYNDARMSLRGLEDFLRGPEWLDGCDAEALNRELLESSYRVESGMGSCPDLGRGDPSNRDHILHAVTLNGLLRPSDRTAAVSLFDPDLGRAHAAMEIMNVDPKTGRGFVTRRDRKESVRCLASACVLFAKYLIMHGRVERRYRESLGGMTSYDSWIARLGL